jgi:lipoprotein-releasing system permease protein
VAPAVRGIDPEAERRVSALATNLVAGSFDVARRDGKNGLLVGTVLAANLHLDVGDRVSVYSHKQLRRLREAQREKREIAIAPDEYEIRGIFEAGLQEFNAMVVITSLATAQELQGLDEADSVNGLTVAIRDPFQAPQAARELEVALGGTHAVTTWLEDSPLMMAVAVEKNMMLYLLFFIVLVAAFGITCTLITFIMMKTREIGVMKAIGATNAQVMRVFVAQSMIVSLFGILTGLGLGLLAVAYRNEFLDLMRRTTGAQLFPADIYQFSQLPALVLPGDLAVICGGSLVICLLAAALPALHASRLNPVEALRNE